MEGVSVAKATDRSTVKRKCGAIVMCADEDQAQASVELLAQLRQMVNNPDFSDVVFNCHDGKAVHACRLLLAGRSDVLKGMFMSGMAESKLSEIALPDISSPVLLSVFEFLYTGTLLDHHPESWRMLCEVIGASRFVLLPNLEKNIRKVMHIVTTAAAQNLPKAASLLTEALGFPALSEKQDVNLQGLITILTSNWSDPDFVRNLSEEAFHYLLSNSKSNCDDSGSHTFKEYFRLRQMIRWCVYQCESEQRTVEALLRSLVPEEGIRLLCRNLPHVHGVENAPEDAEWLSNDMDPFHLKGDVEKSAIRLLSNIDCRKIHPVLLTKVVEPLKLISGAEILEAFRFHAFRRPMIFRKAGCDWALGEAYGEMEAGSVVYKAQDGVGLAVTTEAMSRPFGVYQWRFIVEQFSDTFHELGFIYYVKGGEKSIFNGERLSDQYRARVLNFNGNVAEVNWEGTNKSAEWNSIDWNLLEENDSPTSALFTFNASEHNCSLSVDGEDLGIIWDNLPGAIYYPAVSLEQSELSNITFVRAITEAPYLLNSLDLIYTHGVTEYTKGTGYAQIAIGTDDVYKIAEAMRSFRSKITREPGASAWHQLQDQSGSSSGWLEISVC